jgi:hypothetical protein
MINLTRAQELGIDITSDTLLTVDTVEGYRWEQE